MHGVQDGEMSYFHSLEIQQLGKYKLGILDIISILYYGIV
jgi:hypothetical protein